MNTENMFWNMFNEKSYKQLKLSPGILLEEIQSRVLENDEFESQEKPHEYGSFVFLSQWLFHWKQNNLMFRISKLFKYQNMLIDASMKKCSRKLWKKLVRTQEASYIYITFGILGHSNFRRKMEEKRICIMNHFVQKQNLRLTPWQKKPWQLLWRKSSLIIKKCQINFPFLAILLHQVTFVKK